jgi:hypothetical protein
MKSTTRFLSPGTFAAVCMISAHSSADPAQASIQAQTPPPAAPAAAAPESTGPATTPTSTMDHSISALFNLGYGYGFALGLGVGARYQWVLVPKGFLKLPSSMHDEFAIEPGFDYFHAGYSTGIPGDTISWNYNEFTPLVGAVWNFWLTDHLALYPKIDVGYRIGEWSGSINGQKVSVVNPNVFPVYFQAAAGVDYRIGMFSLRAEAGWEALRAGIGVAMF